MPFPSFEKSAKCLDNRRLGNQRNEAKIILKTILDGDGGWKNHPAVRMWAGHPGALALYLKAIIQEWVARGFQNEAQKVVVENGMIKVWMTKRGRPRTISNVQMPPWLGKKAFHKSHRSNLLRKLPQWYKQFGWKEDDTLPYVWPIEDKQVKTSHL
jgi:hypothetical protein